jgi:hypothetical protein
MVVKKGAAFAPRERGEEGRNFEPAAEPLDSLSKPRFSRKQIEEVPARPGTPGDAVEARDAIDRIGEPHRAISSYDKNKVIAKIDHVRRQGNALRNPSNGHANLGEPRRANNPMRSTSEVDGGGQ